MIIMRKGCWLSSHVRLLVISLLSSHLEFAELTLNVVLSHRGNWMQASQVKLDPGKTEIRMADRLHNGREGGSTGIPYSFRLITLVWVFDPLLQLKCT